MLASTFSEPVKLAVIGGTGLYHLPGLTPVASLDIDTPWGKPSAPITIARTASGHPVAFLSRHGHKHQFTPSGVPAQANIAALKHIGVEAILAFSAVGSLQAEIKPRDFVVATQIIDRTKGIRASTFFDNGLVGHAGFGEPFDPALGEFIGQFGDALEGDFNGEKSILHTKKSAGKDLTIICMEGPAFSTRAESLMYRSFGGSVINMSVLPEAKLAREAEIAYQMVCMSTDYDAWREEEESVTVDAVLGHLKSNGENAVRLCAAVIDPLATKLANGELSNGLKGSMKFSVTAPAGRSAELVKKLDFILPGYYN